MSQNDLDGLRKQIDSLDDKIVELLNARARIATEIGRLKERDGYLPYSPERESEVFRKLEERNNGPLPMECLRSVYRELMSGSLALENNVRVAFLGPPGTFTHIASRTKFGNSVEYRPARDIAGVFEMVSREAVQYGVVPCENSFGSGISLTLELFTKHEAKICAEIYQTVHLDLLGRTTLEEVRSVYSHPHAFQQCQSWIRNNLPAVDLIEVTSTTRAAEKAAGSEGAAAIASREAASRYGLRVLQSGIEDDPKNTTRFFVLSRQYGGISGNDRTSLVLATEDEVGALYEILGTFRRAGLNLTKIESRMGTGRPRDAHFFIDFLGHCSDEKVKRTLSSIARSCRFLTVLGSYPAVR